MLLESRSRQVEIHCKDASRLGLKPSPAVATVSGALYSSYENDCRILSCGGSEWSVIGTSVLDLCTGLSQLFGIYKSAGEHLPSPKTSSVDQHNCSDDVTDVCSNV